ncbi:MAG: hypothetical protein ACOCP8_07720, partial [archaeon]
SLDSSNKKDVLNVKLVNLENDMQSLALDFHSLKNNLSEKCKCIEVQEDKLNLVDNKLNDFSKIVDDKIQSALKTFKYQLSDEVKKNKSVMNSLNETDINYLITDKINLEIKSLRVEFTDEIAKLYDRFYNELLDIKHKKGIFTKDKKNQNVRSKQIKDEDKNVLSKTLDEKREVPQFVDDNQSYEDSQGIFKRFVKWLFVDYEEEYDEEMKDIKSKVQDDELVKEKDTDLNQEKSIKKSGKKTKNKKE